MTLKSLLNIHGKIDWRGQAPGAQAKALVFDSRDVQKGDIYVAIRGNSGDGHDFLDKACQSGAIALVLEDDSQVPKDFSGVVVQVLDTRLSLQVLSQRFYGRPGDKMTAMAVTGTNGKTSSTYILEYLLGKQNNLCGVIGTIDHHIADKRWKTQLTTPDPVTLQKRLQDFLDLGGQSFIIEASSHALEQNRINQGFDVVLFTNLSRDHLDYHKNMEDYFSSKAKLFSSIMLKEDKDCYAIINGDDSYTDNLLAKVEGRTCFLFGRNKKNDISFEVIKQNLGGCQFKLKLPDNSSFEVKSPLIGLHNVYNLVGCLACLYSLGYDVKKAAKDIEGFSGIPGRLQLYKSERGVYSFVDYAHTPEALQEVLSSLRCYMNKDASLITVFGCGGDRDKGKRPLMGTAAYSLSDKVIVTSDNPRSEDPQSIIDDICTGFNHSEPKVFCEQDRGRAITLAGELSKPGDVILVAGKGHEDYQIIGDKILDFSDYKKLKEVLE